MNACSEPGVGLRWASFAVLVLALAVAPAFADNGTTQQPPQPFILDGQNPCLVTDRFHVEGTTNTETRTQEQGNAGLEFRTRSRSVGEGFGTPSGARYTYSDETQNVFRFGPQRPTKMENRRDERLIAHDNRVPSFFHTHREKTVTGADGRPMVCHFREECRCSRSDPQRLECPDPTPNNCQAQG
jgi:hypothetical protein